MTNYEKLQTYMTKIDIYKCSPEDGQIVALAAIAEILNRIDEKLNKLSAINERLSDISQKS